MLATDLVAIRRAAMNLLARRDHSALELLQKLSRRFDNTAQLAQVINQLQADGLQNDQAFAEAYIRWRASRGFGAEHIRHELNQKGVSAADVASAFAGSTIDWQQLLEQQYQKKFNSEPPRDLAEKARYSRFFIRRGFSYQQIANLW